MEKVPKHLSEEAMAIYNGILAEYSITDVAGLRTLQAACEAWDRAQLARASIDKIGMVVKDRFGCVRPHPLLPIERDARAAFLAGLKALDLDTTQETKKRPGRPVAYDRFKSGKVW